MTCDAFAQDGVPLRLRAGLGVGVMVSRDQSGRLGYDSLGLLGDLQLGYALLPFLELQVAVLGGGFLAKENVGGLLAPTLGATLSLPSPKVRPYVTLEVGPGWTARLLRPFFRASVGFEFSLSNTVSIGPIVGYGQLFQTNGPGDSTDARFLSVGLTVAFRPGSPDPVHTTERVRWVTRVSEQGEPAARPSPPPSAADDPELSALLDQAVPAQRVELLAPVLFKFNSAELESVGVAMLHEVARELAHRPDIRLLEVQGYADSRGTATYNLELSERRAERVIEWLVAHGVAKERLRMAAHGSSDFVERGDSEDEHEQNRRVVFRVVEQVKP